MRQRARAGRIRLDTDGYWLSRLFGFGAGAPAPRSRTEPEITRSANATSPTTTRGRTAQSSVAEKEELERAKGFEPSTPTLARLCSTPELHPHPRRVRRPSEKPDGPPHTYAKELKALQPRCLSL